MSTIKRIVPYILCLTLLHSLSSCKNSGFGLQADSLFLVTDDQELFYDLKSPDKKYFLPYVLGEVSGLAWKGKNRLLAVDDESDKVFEYDLDQGEIVHSITFFKSDDFEGVEIVGTSIYVLRSDGVIFLVKYSAEKESKAQKFETDLNKKNDTEGLGYDPETNQLLIACKEKAGIEDDLKGRAFYVFDLDEMKLNPNPLFTIGPKELKRFWEANRDFDYDEEKIKFKPSAIACHPISKNYYIVSSVGRMVVVVNKKGNILATYPIAAQVLGQPEGIAFSPNGDMYLSSEGEGDRGYILKFDMLTK